MALRLATSFVILVIHLHGLSSAADLHQLPNNRLDEGADRELPNATPIQCGMGTPRKVIASSYKNPDQVLTSTIFARDAFTSAPIGSPNGPGPGAGLKYKFAEFHGDKVLRALEIDPSGETAYWLPQGGTVDIPQHPSEGQPHFVFTPDYSGCSWTVTPMQNRMFRLHHVEGGREAVQFNNLSEAAKGGPMSYGIQYKDYGYIVEMRRLVSNVPAFAYMHYTGGRWNLYVQRKSCTPESGGFTFNDQRILSGIVLNEAKQTAYPPISGTKSYTVPQ